MTRRERYDVGGGTGLEWKNCIRMWREHRGLTQARLAGLAFMSPQHLNVIESHGKEPAVSTMIRLAMALNVTVDDLLDVGDAGPFEKFVWRCGDLRQVTTASSEGA